MPAMEAEVKTIKTEASEVVEPVEEATPVEEKEPSTLSTVLAIVGILVVVIVIIWGLAHLISLSEPWFASLFKSTPAAEVQTATSTPSMAATTTLQKVPQSAHKAIAYTSPANLSVRIISATTDQYGRGTFVFDIENSGGSPTGSYTFEAFLPTTSYGASSYTYYSPTQSSLASGAHITDTLTFSQATAGTVSVLVDPSGHVRESDKADNYASQTVAAPY